MPRLASWTPDLVTLDLLLSVAELGSVGKAATAHGMTQPSASARLRRLERQVGAPVLVRSTQGSTLTPAGQAVVVWAEAVVDSAHALTDGIQSLRSGADARLRVAASLTVAEYLLPTWLLTLRGTHPDVEVTATVANSRAVAEAVRAGTVDVGFVESPQVPTGFGHVQVAADRLVLAASPSWSRVSSVGRPTRPGMRPSRSVSSSPSTLRSCRSCCGSPVRARGTRSCRRSPTCSGASPCCTA